MIKCIIFDLGDVLLTGGKETGLKLARLNNIDCATDQRIVSLGDYKTPHPLIVPLIKEFFNGNVTEEEYLGQVIEMFPELGNIEDLKLFIREEIKEVEGTRNIILKLKSLDYKIGLLSVHGREWIDFCEKKFDFHKMFDAIAFSYDDGVSKPDPRAYELILQRLGARPEECIFIDDTQRNIEAAERLGIKGIVFTNSEELNTILEELLEDYK